MHTRALMPDYLRLVALFGIVTVNVAYMAFSVEGGFEAATTINTADRLVIVLVNGLTYLKTYGLFSFMFGVGLSFQIASAKRRDVALGPKYRNRLIGLALFGLLHGFLFFVGDILVLYALTGGVLYLWRDWPVRRLVWTGAALLGVHVAVAVIMVLPGEPLGDDILTLERAVMTEGSWLDVVAFRSVSFSFVFPLLLFFQGFAALGWFCLGLAAVRHGMIDSPSHPLWRRARQVCLVPGVVLSLAGATLWAAGRPFLGEVVIIAVAPVATLGYLGLIAALARPPGPLMAGLLKAGGASLTVYLGQSVVLSTIFAPYGLALWDSVSPAQAVGLALLSTALLILAVLGWRQYFADGPLEFLLKRLGRAGRAGS